MYTFEKVAQSGWSLEAFVTFSPELQMESVGRLHSGSFLYHVLACGFV